MLINDILVSIGDMHETKAQNNLYSKLRMTHVFRFVVRENENADGEKIRTVSRKFTSIESTNGVTFHPCQERHKFNGETLTIGDDVTIYKEEDETHERWMAFIKTLEVEKHDGSIVATREKVMLLERDKRETQLFVYLNKEFQENLEKEAKLKEDVKRCHTLWYVQDILKEQPSLTTIDELLAVLKEKS